MHVEFPELTPEVKAAFLAACSFPTDLDQTPPTPFERKAFAAFLREVINQSTDPNGILFASDLQAIANSLHNPPPTLAQALGADLDTYAGKHLVRVFLATLREGA